LVEEAGAGIRLVNETTRKVIEELGILGKVWGWGGWNICEFIVDSFKKYRLNARVSVNWWQAPFAWWWLGPVAWAVLWVRGIFSLRESNT
jgi:hypothetical protein